MPKSATIRVPGLKTACLTPYRRAGRRTASGLEAFEAALEER
jgi:hypothetical protein